MLFVIYFTISYRKMVYKIWGSKRKIEVYYGQWFCGTQELKVSHGNDVNQDYITIPPNAECVSYTQAEVCRCRQIDLQKITKRWQMHLPLI